MGTGIHFPNGNDVSSSSLIIHRSALNPPKMATLECVQDLEENDKDIREDAVKTLLRISSNILKSPKETKFRTLKVSFHGF